MKLHTLMELIWILILVISWVSGQWLPIQDLPIELYEPEEYYDSHMDHELLLRQSRTTEKEDPKEEFFRFLENYPEEANRNGRELPPLEAFPEEVKDAEELKRSKRQAPEDEDKEDMTENIMKRLGKPLELGILIIENSTLASNESTEATRVPEEALATNFLINDFIRFKRQSAEADDGRNGSSINEVDDLNISTKKNEADASEEKSPQTQKLQMEPQLQESNRQPRGAIKEEWSKYPYLVERRDDDIYDDSLSSPSEPIRAPRVHFVTQRRSEPLPPPPPLLPLYRSFEREGRSRDSSREMSREYPRESDYYTPRYTRNYNPLPPPRPPPSAFEHRRFNPYLSRYEERRERYDSRFDPPIYDRERERERYVPTYPRQNRQRRIIYYANLPEITRSPPTVDFRDRYNSRDRDNYDDRYLNGVDPYRFNKGYNKPRYDAATKTPYPLKVSTDVNVREIKKNPERRIYSEVDRRYAYQAPSYNSESTRHQ